MAPVTKLGLAYINDPDEDEGVVYTKSEGEGSSPRDIGAYRIKNRYTVMGVPMIAVQVVFDTGHQGYGRKRADGPGFVDVFAYKDQGNGEAAQS